MFHRSRHLRHDGRGIIDALGWYGVFAILGAYALVSWEFLAPGDVRYQLLNLTGAVSIALEAFSRKDYQPTILNLVWALIACVAILRLF